jgi:RNA polymerase sigma factor (TIGR02999 family)
VTELLLAHRDGAPGAFDRLVELIYPELRGVAHRQLRRGRPDGQLLDTTGLVHEAYLKLVDQTRIGARDRSHFLAIAARAMRQVIVDHARVRSAAKRGASAPHVPLDDRDLAIQQQAEHLLSVNDALERLAEESPRLRQVVECRFFAGYTEVETANALAVSPRTVERDWLRAKAWLREAIDALERVGSGRESCENHDDRGGVAFTIHDLTPCCHP